MKLTEKLKIFISEKSSKVLNNKKAPVKGKPLTNFTYSNFTSNLLTFQSNTAKINISAYSPHIAKIYLCTKNKNTLWLDTHSWSIIEQKQQLNEPIKSGAVYQVKLTKQPSGSDNKIDFNELNGEFIFTNYNNQVLITLRTVQASNNWLLLMFVSQEEYLVLGLGENTPPMNKANSSIIMWNTDNSTYEMGDNPLYQSWPVVVFLSPKNFSFALVFDNPSYSQFKFSNNGKNFDYNLNDTEIPIYILFGPTLKDVQQQLSYLTGYLPPLPKWALGYQQSRWSYSPSTRLREIANKFREKNIPCDVLFIDIDYMDQYMCFTWGEDFDDYKTLIQDLHAQGFKIIPIIDPGIKIEQKYPVYNSGIANKMFITGKKNDPYITKVWPGRVHFPDFASASVRKWWSELVRNFLVDSNVDGIWCDMNEPSTFDPRRTLPTNLLHNVNLLNEDQDIKLFHKKIHNVYGFLMVKATYEGIAETMELPFVLTRASYLGGQRYGITWTGDNKSSWNHLRASIPMLLNLGLSGQPISGPDIGGFRGNCFSELYKRWIVQGAFFPFSRSHTAKGTNDQEPWSFDDVITNIAREAIQLRYKLLPYYYSVLYVVCTSGGPMMRPLFYEDIDPLTLDPYYYESQFFIGSALMFAPFMDEQAERTYYLPNGIWYNWWTFERLEGNKVYSIVDSDKIPLFIRENSIIPFYSTPLEYISDTSLSNLELIVTVTSKADILIPEYFTKDLLLGLKCGIVKKELYYSIILEIERKGSILEKYQLPKNIVIHLNAKINTINFENPNECKYTISNNAIYSEWTKISLESIKYPIKIIISQN